MTDMAYIHDEINTDDIDVSLHYQEDRAYREKIIKYIIGEGEIRKSIYVKNTSNNLSELTRHNITSTGIDIITSPDGKKVITKTILRPQQAVDLYKQIGETPPAWLMEEAWLHTSRRYNCT